VKKLKFKLKLLTVPLFITAFFCGCATVQLSKSILDFSITPETGIKAGTIVTVSVKAAEDVQQVLGSIDMMGSPRIELKFDPTKKTWYLRRMIPLGFVIPPGEYLTKIEAITKTGEHYFAEKKIVIQ
jgi:hypothetical protein